MSSKATFVTPEQRASLMKSAMEGLLTDSDVKTAVEMGKSLSKSTKDKDDSEQGTKEANND